MYWLYTKCLASSLTHTYMAYNLIHECQPPACIFANFSLRSVSLYIPKSILHSQTRCTQAVEECKGSYFSKWTSSSTADRRCSWPYSTGWCKSLNLSFSSNCSPGDIQIQRFVTTFTIVMYTDSNRIYLAAIRLFRSWLLSRATKIILYKTLIRPVVSYGAEAWTLTKKDEQDLPNVWKENI